MSARLVRVPCAGCGRAVAALGVELLDRRAPVDADRVARIVRDECGVSL